MQDLLLKIHLGSDRRRRYTPPPRCRGWTPRTRGPSFALGEGVCAMSGRSRDGGRRGRVRLWWLALALLAPLSSSARAADIETRDYTVNVSGKPAGEVHMTIHRRDDGQVWMRCDTDI